MEGKMLQRLSDAIDGLDSDFDTYENHYQLQDATRKRVTEFEDAVGEHPRKSELIRYLQQGEASAALGVARAIFEELKGSVASATAS